jgi:hypothetical protein
MSRRNTDFQSIRSEGGLLPPDLLRRVIDPKSKLDGTRPEDYGLPAGERLNEVITESWKRLRKHWAEFRAAATNLPEGEAGTGLTNDKWNLPVMRELGFGMLPTSAGPEIAGRTYAINRFVGPVPIHLIGCGLSLDRRAAGVRGAAAGNPHGLVQEFVNRSPDHLWAILSNGRQFRVLRDNQALSRQSYLEFDLDAMFAGELYSDFVLLWLLAHATRFAPREGERPESCWLERWTKIAEEDGTRALTDLRGGVERALAILGQGLVSHPKNTALRESLRKGDVKLSDFHGQLLRVVYRLIFLFVAEDRDLEGIPLIHPQDKSDKARLGRERYAAHYSTGRLRELASRIKGSRHGDLWRQFQLTVGALSGDDRFAAMREALALPSLGSMLWDSAFTSLLNGPGLAAPGAELTNYDFLETLRNLAYTRQGKILRPVDYKNLGSEEFGGVYESFLALTPQISSDGARFTFAEFAGNERKTSGSYYTPDSLVQCLLDSALDPVVEERLADAERLAKSDWPAVEKETQSDPAKRNYVLAFLTKRAGAERGAAADALKRAWDSIPAATRRGQLSEEAMLAIKVCDKACGSGHFLVGAAHRLARHLARVRALAAGESEPSPLLYQTALRDVIGHCLYGVDINPMAVELCKVTLSLEALEPGKPLSFLDHHIRCGNSLLGATPALMEQGIPDDVFVPIDGDDKKYCANFKKVNKQEAKNVHGQRQDTLFDREQRPWEHIGEFASDLNQLADMPDDSPEQIRLIEGRYLELTESANYEFGTLLADTWCSAFVWKKCNPADGGFDYPITNDIFQKLKRDPLSLTDWMLTEVRRLTRQYQFFHWHIEFPDVFGGDGKGGFDVMLGNPPWERVKLQEKEWFAERRPEIAEAPNTAARKRLIERLAQDDPALHTAFGEAARQAEGESHILRDSGLFPLCGCGDVNLFAVFAEAMRERLAPIGRMGAVLPSGIATDDTTKLFFQSLVESSSIVSLFSFENEEFLFPGVHHAMKFCLLTVAGASAWNNVADFLFYARRAEQVHDIERRFTLSSDEIALLNPNTKTCPVFRRRRDSEICRTIYQRVPVLWLESERELNPWRIAFSRMFDMANDSSLFRNRDDLSDAGYRIVGNHFVRERTRYLPLYEAKMVDRYDHRAAGVVLNAEATMRQGVPVALDHDAHRDPNRMPQPRYWVSESDTQTATQGRNDTALLGFCDVTAATNERTMIAALVPRVAVGHTFPVMYVGCSEQDKACLLACLNSFVFDYVGRQKMGGIHYTYFILKQLPVLPPATYAEPCAWPGQPAVTHRDWLLPRVLELTYTAWDLELFARDCGWFGPPFVWDEARRFLLRCELDAAFFHLYLGSEEEWRKQPAALTQAFPTPRDAVSYMMDTFPIVKRKDEARTEQKNAAGEVVKPGRYITKDTILEIYDALIESIRTGTPYQTRLNPPPADPRCCHPKRKIAILAFGSLRNDPGKIGEHIAFRIKTETPFPVEYGRLSQSRGGGPTLVPHEKGAKVGAELLILPDDMPLERARDLLWLRERRKEDNEETYSAGTGPNHVLVREWNKACEFGECPWVETVLYTDFNPSGKQTLTAEQLAKAAIESVGKADEGKDGITYLAQAEKAGIHTPLTKTYREAILKQTGTQTLAEAREHAALSIHSPP